MLAKLLFSGIVLLISFCGISYQFLISRVLIQFSQNEVLNQSVTLGFYLLSMGLGAALTEKLFSEKKYQNLYFLEIAVAILGILTVPLIYAAHVGLNIFVFNTTGDLFYGEKAVFIFQIFTILIGLLTGCELPLLMAVSQNDNKLKINHSKILGLSYFGALAGSIFSSGLIFSKMDFISNGIWIGLMSLIAGVLILVAGIDKIKKKYTLALLAPLFLAYFTMQATPRIDQIFLKDYYINMKIPTFSLENMKTILKFFRTVENIERYVTNYQIIDLIPDGFMNKYDRDNEFTVYLNNQVQFGRKDFKMYHETMVHGAINMVDHQPAHVLILGGGDGLILAELLKVSQVKAITQVELDPQMIELASFHPVMKELNQSVYNQDRVKLIYEDGFSYIRKTEEKFDAVFIDFPFPTSYDLSKLYSLEFYRSLKKIMKTNAFFVFDAPIKINSNLGTFNPEPSPQDIILSTLHAAEFNNISAFGLTESFYVVSVGSLPLRLNYEKLPAGLTNQTIANLAVLNHALGSAKVSKNYVNSIFRPQKFIFK